MMAFITRTKFTLGCVFLVLLGLAVPGWGQSLNGSLSGKVTDPSHASVPSALVTVQPRARLAGSAARTAQVRASGAAAA